jgi:diguanylate cyclase (GGDEF)-like protein
MLLVDLGRARPHDDDTGDHMPDPVLTAAARRLETCLRASDGVASLSRDHLVARLRGDEFAILLDGLAEMGDARVVADRVLGELLTSFMVEGDEVFLSSSIGIAVSATGYARAEAVVRDADTALHRAQLLGRGRCEVFDTAILKSAQTALQLDTDFMEALSRDEFVLYFQPVVALDTQRVAGFEALVRWRHPTRGMISPAEFIPLAEKTGFIVPLGLWTLRQSCLQLKAWRDSQIASDDVWVSVNLSTPQFKHPSLAEDVAGALASAGIPARCLVVELTEGVAMENPAAVKGLLMQLRVMGVRVALDDFGSGQSSLAYLHQFPADKLKLDRSFVCDMESRNDVREIVGAVTALAHQLGLEVIAEGVETDGQLVLVRSLQCEYVQGFVFSRPVDRERAAELLRTGFAPQPARAQAPGEPAASERPAHASECAPSATRRRLPRVVYVPAAAVITLALAGLLTRFTGTPKPDPAPASITQPPAPEPTVPKVARGAAGLPAAGATKPLTNPGAPPAAPATTPGTASETRSKRDRAPVSVTDTLPVVHKHTLRSCRGQLTVTAKGVDYRADKPEDHAKDGFTSAFGDFSSSLSGDELTIKTAGRTYRFKAADTSAADGGRTRLQAVAARLSRVPTGTKPPSRP